MLIKYCEEYARFFVQIILKNVVKFKGENRDEIFYDFDLDNTFNEIFIGYKILQALINDGEIKGLTLLKQ